VSDADGVTAGVTETVNRDTETNVEESLREFLDVLGSSETYQEFAAAEAALEADDEATALLREYEAKRAELQRNEFDESVMAELKQLQTAVSDNETIQRRRDAREQLVELLDETNTVIGDEIGETFARSNGGGCC
jgi:cell fate (sporulation/competence/biofilm development) regulator YlbF (YheA/YmcA/DUF963 family)